MTLNSALPLRIPLTGLRHAKVCFRCLLLSLAILTLGGLERAMAQSSRVPWTENRVTGSPEAPPPFKVQQSLSGLTFSQPVDFAFMPGSKRLFVAEQSGKIWALDLAARSSLPQLVLDLRKERRPIDGILGFTFHPGFATNRFIFVNYNEPGGRENGARVSRFTVSLDPTVTINPASERTIIQWLSGGHNGCTLAFGGDGYLYISTGDAADPDPPDGKRRTGQDISDLLASILRIDVNRTDGTNAYAVPRDNPFLGVPGARPEVWAFGFRNPYRMSFDQATGDLWVGDVGWETWEMVHRVQRGGNYGWPLVEGPNTAVRRDVPAGPGPILPPVISLPHTDAASITGGVFYRGRRLPELGESYVYGDWETGKFWSLRHRNGVLTTNTELCDTSLKPVAFTLDPEGELLILDYNGGVYELIRNEPPLLTVAFPRTLSESGLFRSLKPLEPAAGVAAYRIAAPLWNDHATATWHLGVPGEDSIVTAGGVGNIAGPTWNFPTNTVLARTASLEMRAGDPESSRQIETQILHWDGQAWNAYSYHWRDDQTDADLVPREGTNQVFVVADALAPGGRRSTPWRFLGRTECLRCHNVWAGEALTLNPQQLGSADVPESEMARLISLGLVTPKNMSEAEPLAYPHDESFTLEERARSWLHVNCSTCHRFGAGGMAAVHLSSDKSRDQMRAIDARPLRGDFALDAARVIAPGDPYRSTLLYRILTEGSGRMPHIGSRLVDVEGVKLMTSWIRSLPSPRTPDSGVASARKKSEDDAKLINRLQDDWQRPVLLRLLGTTSGSLALAAELHDAGSLSDSNRALLAEFTTTHTNAFVRELFQPFLLPEQRRQTLGDQIDPQKILAQRGDAGRGREVFHGLAGCARCHQAGESGRAFGPNLDGLGQRYNKGQLLAEILEPTKTIAQGYKSFTIRLSDDTELNGFVMERTDKKVVLLDETLRRHELSPSQWTEIRESSISAMPEGLLAPLTAQEAADLLQFLISLPVHR